MRDLKTYLSVAPVVSTLCFGALAGLLIEINRFFPDALIFPFFLYIETDEALKQHAINVDASSVVANNKQFPRTWFGKFSNRFGCRLSVLKSELHSFQLFLSG